MKQVRRKRSAARRNKPHDVLSPSDERDETVLPVRDEDGGEPRLRMIMGQNLGEIHQRLGVEVRSREVQGSGREGGDLFLGQPHWFCTVHKNSISE